MRKHLLKYIAGLLTIICFPLNSAFAQKYENGLIDKVVALIGNEMIMLSQLEGEIQMMEAQGLAAVRDRKSTRLNSSHVQNTRMPSSA